MSDELTPFRIEIIEEQLDDLRERLRRTRWPEAETVTDWSQGVSPAYLRELCDYWADRYDWRATEARLNALPQFRTSIDGPGIHFIHARSPHPDALPLVLTHGWPGSIVEFLNVIGPLTDPPPTAARPPTPSTWSVPRCRATASASGLRNPAGAWNGSPPRGRR